MPGNISAIKILKVCTNTNMIREDIFVVHENEYEKFLRT